MTHQVLYPNDDLEREIIADGSILCGMDEVGRGAWAGPLVLAAVIPGVGTIPGVRDSKKISSKKREVLDLKIRDWAQGIGIGSVTNVEIDQIGLARAITLGAHRALENLERTSIFADTVLLDGHYDFICDKKYKVKTIIKGDNVSHAIAAASIVAKVFRDEYMSSDEVASKYPLFGFEKNKGYPAPIHKNELAKVGPTPLHRISWNIFGDSFSINKQNTLM